MRRPMTRREMLLALAAGSFSACSRFRSHVAQSKYELILCGADEVFILSTWLRGIPNTGRIWSWRAADCPNLRDALHATFRSTDDCKPVEDGKRILITSSSNGVALVERATKRAVFNASVINAHSAEALPGGRIVVASSVSQSEKGNRLVLFDIAAPEKEIFSDPLVSAHGVVWDEKRRILWALGYDELRAYRLGGWETASPALERKGAFALPDTSGHDLSPIPGSPNLFVSTGEHCWYFDRDKGRFAPHDVLADARDVKSYSVNRWTGRIAYTQAEGTDWWTDRVHFLKPKGFLPLPGQRLYKVRWNA